MTIGDRTLELLADLARRPGHDEVKADFRELLVEEFGADRSSLDFEVRAPIIKGRLDALIGRTVFEAKRNLDREMDDVLRRMPDYLSDREREYGEPFVGIASDGLKWVVFELAGDELQKIKETTLDPEKAELRVIYAASGTLPAAMVLRDERAIIEHKLYWAKSTSEDEAHYLCAVLNSETARSQAEQFQSRGQFGARDFDKVIFNLPIPVFDNAKALHTELAQAGALAEAVAADVELKEGEKFQRARKRIRDALAEDGIGGEIEKLVEKLLGPL